MARNGSGTYSNPYPNFVSGTVISSSETDANNSDIATALTQSIAVDGQSTLTADIPMNAKKLTGLAVGSAATDSLNLRQAQAEAMVWCGTAGGTANAITLSPSPAIAAYAAGQRFVWMASSSVNTGATTVAISGLGAIALQDNGAALVAGNHAASKMFMGVLNTTSTVQIMQVQISGTDPLIVSSLTVSGDALIGDDLTLNSDAAVLGFGENTDVTLTHVHDTGILLNSTMAIQFNDSSQYINAPSNTILDINATDEIELNATLVDVNANLEVSGTSTHGGNILSDTDSTDSIGSTSVRWLKGWFDTLTAGNLTIGSGSIVDSSGAISFGDEALTTTGVITGATIEPTADTSASDNAAIGYSAAEGLILTGQGSSGDVTIKNDADGKVMEVLTGTTTAAFSGAITASSLTISTDLSVANGGTGASTFAANGVLYGAGTGAIAATAVGTDGHVLTSNGSGSAPTFQAAGSGGLLQASNNLSDVAAAATSATNLGLGTGNSPQFTAVNIGAATDTTITRVSAGVIAVEGTTILDTADIGVSVQAYDADTLKADVADELTAGFSAAAHSAGTKSSGTYTPDVDDGNFQHAINGGAHTLAVPAKNCTMVILYKNNASAGTITTSGYTVTDGDSLTTTNGHEFFFYITRINDGSTTFSMLTVKALQ